MTAHKKVPARILDLATGPWLPSWTFLGSYLVTTVLGASLLLTAAGRARLAVFLGRPEVADLQVVGTPEYYVLLYLPLIAMPLFAYLGMRLVTLGTYKARREPGGLEIRLPQRVLVVMGLAAGGYSVFRLARLGKLVPRLLLDPTATYEQRIIERTEFFEALGFGFYVVAYAVLPTITACFLARYILAGRRPSDGVCFLASYLGCHYLGFALLMKAPFVLLALLLSATAVIARASWVYLVGLGSVCAAALLLTQLLLGGFQPKEAASAQQAAEEATTVHAGVLENGSGAEEVATPGAAADTAPGQAAPTGTASFDAARGDGASEAPAGGQPPSAVAVRPQASVRLVGQALSSLATSIVFRMASSFPFYLDVFSDPAERCGIETNRLPFLPRPRCVLPAKVFERMYPQIDWVQGFAPAAAHVSAYGEVGLGYAMLIMAISGLMLGALGKVAQLGSGPLFAVFGAVVCMFAYYLSQVPFIGALSYGHGLIPYLAPVLVLLLAAVLPRRV